MSTTGTTIDLEQQMLGEVEMVGRDPVGGESSSSGCGRIDSSDCSRAGPRPQDGPPLLRQTEWKRYRRRRGRTRCWPRSRSICGGGRRRSATRRRCCSRSSGAGVPRQLRDGEAVRAAVAGDELHAAVTRTRFETPPGLQSQIDWGQARVRLGAAWEVRHVFVLTLGFSRRSVYVPCLSEALGDLLDAHEQAFAHFGGHTQEHLYDRPRTVCAPSGTNGVRWNTTFKAFADFWDFEPRLCRRTGPRRRGRWSRV